MQTARSHLPKTTKASVPYNRLPVVRPSKSEVIASATSPATLGGLDATIVDGMQILLERQDNEPLLPVGANIERAAHRDVNSTLSGIAR